MADENTGGVAMNISGSLSENTHCGRFDYEKTQPVFKSQYFSTGC